MDYLFKPGSSRPVSILIPTEPDISCWALLKAQDLQESVLIVRLSEEKPPTDPVLGWASPDGTRGSAVLTSGDQAGVILDNWRELERWWQVPLRDLIPSVQQKLVEELADWWFCPECGEAYCACELVSEVRRSCERLCHIIEVGGMPTPEDWDQHEKLVESWFLKDPSLRGADPNWFPIPRS